MVAPPMRGWNSISCVFSLLRVSEIEHIGFPHTWCADTVSGGAGQAPPSDWVGHPDKVREVLSDFRGRFRSAIISTPMGVG